MKKGQGLSINTMVLAALALVVLLIGLAIITGTGNNVIPFFKKQNECTSRGGVCSTEALCTDVKVYGLKDCDSFKPVCCVK